MITTLLVIVGAVAIPEPAYTASITDLPLRGGVHLEGALRSLQQTTSQVGLDIEPDNITLVDTPQSLLQAVQDGALDIVVTDHLDLTTLPLLPTSICTEGCESPLGEIAKTRSIRGRCTTQPDAADFPGMNGIPLVPTTTGQCFMLTHDDMLGIVVDKFWADNLYLRAALPAGNEREFHFPALAVVPPLSTGVSAAVYLTNMIFQGDGEGSVVGVGADDKVFVSAFRNADSLFTSLGGARDLACTECSSNIEARAAVSVKNSAFEKLITAPGSVYIRAYKGGSVRLQNNTYASATKAFEVQDTGVEKAVGFYSDVTTLKLELTETAFATRPVSSLDEIPAEDPDIPGAPLFLSEDDEWFVAVQQTLKAAPLEPTADEDDEGTPGDPADPGASGGGWDGSNTDTSDSSKNGSSLGDDTNGNSNSNSTPAIIAATVGVIVLVAALIAAIFLVWRYKKKKAMQHSKPAEGTEYPAKYPPPPPKKAAVSAHDYYQPPPGALQRKPENSMHAPDDLKSTISIQSTPNSNIWSGYVGPHVTLNATGSTPSGTVDTGVTTFTNMTVQNTSSLGEAPTGSASIEDRMEFLHAQLDSLAGTALMQRFVLSSGTQNRRQGGQGVVAFATGDVDGLDYAIKFFMNRPSYLAETELYSSQTLGKLLPQIEGAYDPEDVADSEVLTDKAGNRLPPFLVMEKGESLIDWSKRNRSDVFQAVAVLAHVGMRLKDLHAAGMCHRDIKPGNIMLLHRKNRWTLIDFGCVANIGQPAGLSFTLHYAAPEVVHAWRRGEKRIVADGAVDAWALGVVAFELLTRKQAFQLIVQGQNEVVRQIIGEEELPWEGESLRAEERKLGRMKEPVLALLHRDPAQRMTATQFVRECNSLFAVNTMDIN